MPQIQSKANIFQNDISFISLEHISGVNALKENQIIKFSKDVTILYGLNGSGKSSYFRILNEMVGGNNQKPIIQNIYVQTHKTVNVNFKYKIDSKEKNISAWNGKARAIADLTRCFVFDSSYLNGFLDVRKVDEAIVQPLGLHLFSYIASEIDKIRDKLKELALQEKNKKPHIDYSFLSDGIKNVIINNLITEDQCTFIKNNLSFSEDKKQKLNAISKEIKQLEQTNYEDTIKLLKKQKDEYSNFKDSLINTLSILCNKKEYINTLIDDYITKKNANNNAKNKYEVFKSIPENDSTEWKQFISAGNDYVKKINDLEVCPYCRQPLLSDDARNLLKAYADYLQDNSEKELNTSKSKIKIAETEINNIIVDIDISEDIKTLFKDKIFQETPDKKTPILEYIEKIISSFKLEKENLLKQLEIKNKSNDKLTISLSEITNILDSETETIQKKIEEIVADSSTKDNRIIELQKEQKILQENESISNQKEKFQQWIEKDSEEKRLNKLAASLSTNSITRLSNEAHKNLITETLKKNFETELQSLGRKDLKINLVEAGGTKGTQTNKLTLVNTNDIKTILSEGEQKAVGLALFLAEIKSQNTKNTIILDDPVNSLDHKIASSFADRLLELENQVIIFTHNRLFLDAFECSNSNNHVCKTIDSDCNNTKGKHIRIYSIESEGLNSKGVLSNYKQNKVDSHLREVKKLVEISPFDRYLDVASNIRKCVECCIDEIIFNNQIPTKLSNKNSRINWAELEHLCNDRELINSLHEIHDRVSGGELHNGTESLENSITVDEFKDMVKKLEEIIDAYKKS